MWYETSLYSALAVFGAGLIFKISGWFRFKLDIPERNPNALPEKRIMNAFKGTLSVIFSPKFTVLVKVFVRDVLLQMRILDEDFLRWLMHILIFTGFMFLLFTHALDKIIVTSLFDPYYLKMNPFLLGAGLMVLAGVAIALYRRLILKVPRLKTTAMDYYVLILLTVIILSGMAMELTKLTSYNFYQKIWYIHIFACLFGLAYLPFSKLFHVFTTPLSLLANAVMEKNRSSLANIRTRQMMEMDACTRCGTCSNRCSVAVAFDSLGNEMILPSERMDFLKAYFSDKHLNAEGLKAIQQGIYLCTNCDRCTVACPAGINLRELWFDVREEMVQRRSALELVLTPFSLYRGLNRRQLNPDSYAKPLINAQDMISKPCTLLHNTEDIIPLTRKNREFKQSAGLSLRAETYAYCFACENCSTICPVVGHYEDPQKSLGMLPHQIMRSMGFGIKDLVIGSKMLWYCLTCYQCQEHCPQGVNVTDVLYELKNLAVNKAIVG